ncbi:hypothetical protein JOB18_002695 [Solea senegalensis]|uniref:Uncharacterized protein n=1 Tax=Solea senegalensis TaxID=28829 RepID=A0AAV6QE15_SOLSE|nr:hypothetical protein JOB18_002695 [Solea senegalensis]
MSRRNVEKQKILFCSVRPTLSPPFTSETLKPATPLNPRHTTDNNDDDNTDITDITTRQQPQEQD